jgi:HNH endonuclease
MNIELSALPERVQAKIYVEPNSGCWLWLGAMVGSYGVVRIANRNVYIHRFCREWFFGPIREGLILDHLCRTPRCCNPIHVEAVTYKMNTNRGRRFNAEKTHCKRGHPFDEANTYIHPSDGHRQCRACARMMMARYWKTHNTKK